MLTHSNSMLHSIAEFVAVSTLALFTLLFKTLGFITLSNVVGFVTICAGLSTLYLNYKRLQRLKQNKEDVSE